MNNLKTIGLVLLTVIMLSSCVISMPAGVTSNYDGAASKTGSVSGTFLFGFLPLGFNIDLSTEAAARQGNITEVHSTNTVYKNYFIISTLETQVKGN